MFLVVLGRLVATRGTGRRNSKFEIISNRGKVEECFSENEELLKKTVVGGVRMITRRR